MTVKEPSPRASEMESERIENRKVVEQRIKRPGIVTKKMLIMSSMICGGIAFLLWAVLGFPQKSKNPVIFNNKTCSEDSIICPQSWNRINNNCFFQSEREKTWMDGQTKCTAHSGSLAIFNSKNEVESLMPYLGPSCYWIGLKMDSTSKLWIWTNGDVFSNWFSIDGSGECACMFQKGISSGNCSDAKKYTCSRKGFCP
ncbi:hypothetical protein R6Z07F_005237 [Ovis aries]|uniref:Uncharacterized protein n=1 Tax=Ovis aries TaxID=9940 RepID=A0AC11EJ44_SHEEP|nr:C-type lectin domain family 2 member F-like isoform X1 [Ovis aries]